MPKKHHVLLSVDQCAFLSGMLHAGTHSTHRLTHARVLLKANEGPEGPALTDEQIADDLEIDDATVARIRKRFAEKGFDAALDRAPTTRVYARKLDGAQEARLIAIACSPAPDGQADWSLRLLADRLVDLAIVDTISYQTVGRTLKKTKSSPSAFANG